jgi:small redox-active disulfide protein 2
MITIKILGTGCPNCKRLTNLVQNTAAELQIEAEIVKVENMTEIVGYGVMSTPGLVVEEDVVSSGRVPSVEEISTWLQSAASA